ERRSRPLDGQRHLDDAHSLERLRQPDLRDLATASEYASARIFRRGLSCPEGGTSMRKAAILGGVRIPFARQNTNYVAADNVDMLSAALRGVVERFALRGERLGEVVAGAVLKHTRETNISREAALNSGLSSQTPAFDVQQACATSLEAAI